MKPLLFILIPLSSFAQPYIGGGLALGTYTKTVHRNYVPALNVTAGYIVHYAAIEAYTLVPLDNNHPISIAFHAGIYIPGDVSFMLLAGPEYHYQELYKYPLDEKQTQRPVWNLSGVLRCMKAVNETNIFISAGYAQGMPVAGVGILTVIK